MGKEEKRDWERGGKGGVVVSSLFVGDRRRFVFSGVGGEFFFFFLFFPFFPARVKRWRGGVRRSGERESRIGQSGGKIKEERGIPMRR